MMPASVAPLPPMTVLAVQVRGLTCALPLAAVVEVMRPQPLQVLTGLPVGVAGLAQIRGVAVPVLDLGALLADMTPAEPATRLVSVRANGRIFALQVDRVLGVRQLDAQLWPALPPLLAQAAGTALQALGPDTDGEATGGDLLLLLEMARLVSAEMWALASAPEAVESA